jgi:diaminopimelate epimerase
MKKKSKQINFTKMVASGNDFVVIDQGLKTKDQRLLKDLARNICNRKFGVGADGLLVLEKSKVADLTMRIFNADGSEAEMCGNGARCVAYYYGTEHMPACRKDRAHNLNMKIETKAGIIEAEVKEDNIKIKLTEPKDMQLGIPLMVSDRAIKVNFINTGVPHAVIFVEGIEKIGVDNLGKEIRFHDYFKPTGTNVDFVEVNDNYSIKVRTYERGVEAETLACGTGSVASALITAYNFPSAAAGGKMNVLTKSREILKVYFNKLEGKFNDVWLEGKAKIVYNGGYYV